MTSWLGKWSTSVRLVVNASPLILLSSCDQIQLLSVLSTEVVVPEAVLAELVTGEDRDQVAAGVGSADWIRVVGTSAPQAVRVWGLGAGETAVLSWASAHAGWTAVLDDRAARKCARASGIPYVGTLGVVLAAKDAGIVDAARPILEAMLEADYYLGGEVLERALAGVGK